MNVHRTFDHYLICTPKQIQDLATAEDPARALCEYLHDFELGEGEIQPFLFQVSLHTYLQLQLQQSLHLSHLVIFLNRVGF